MSSPSHVLSVGLTVAVIPSSEPDQHLGLTFRTSNLVIVSNSLPLLSAIQNLIELSDLPTLLLEETSSDVNDYEEQSVTPLGIRMNLVVAVENTRILFLVDRKKISRGILSLSVCGLGIDFESGGLSGKLSFVTQPITLSAGQILHDQSSSPGGQIDHRLMPFTPILDVNGAALQILGEEDHTPRNASDPETAATIRLNVDLQSQSILVKASPSTIVALLGVFSSLEPFLDWAVAEQKAGEEELQSLEAKRHREQEQDIKCQYQVLQKIFQEIDVDGSGELSEDELELFVLKLVDENNFANSEENQKITRAKELTAYEVKVSLFQGHLLFFSDSFSIYFKPCSSQHILLILERERLSFVHYGSKSNQ